MFDRSRLVARNGHRSAYFADPAARTSDLVPSRPAHRLLHRQPVRSHQEISATNLRDRLPVARTSGLVRMRTSKLSRSFSILAAALLMTGRASR